MLVLEVSLVQVEKVGCGKWCYPNLKVNAKGSLEADAVPMHCLAEVRGLLVCLQRV
jgi:hypothetical protein